MSSCLLLGLEIQLCNKAYTDLLVKRHKQLAWFRSSKLSWHPIRCLKSALEQSKWRGTKNSRYKLIVCHLLTKRSKLVILVREGEDLICFFLCVKEYLNVLVQKADLIAFLEILPFTFFTICDIIYYWKN